MFIIIKDNKIMKKLLLLGLFVCGASLSGCTGAVYNQSKNCSYHYLLHPAVSVSKVIGGCGPISELPPQK
jgi:hypothetical protein